MGEIQRHHMEHDSSIFIVANWKMNPQSIEEAKRLAGEVAEGVKDLKEARVVLCPPFPFLSAVHTAAPAVALGGQDCSSEQSGAYTGQVSPAMLKNSGCRYVILGHSERRKFCDETPELVNKKIQSALAQSLVPIVCVGEENESGWSSDELGLELKTLFSNFSEEDMEKIILAYEPVWAISSPGTYRPASPAIVSERLQLLREGLSKISSARVGKEIAILYGGSVNGENARGFVKETGAQGVLVGQASLNASAFCALVKSVIS